jgi:hypothetical protein
MDIAKIFHSLLKTHTLIEAQREFLHQKTLITKRSHQTKIKEKKKKICMLDF